MLYDYFGDNNEISISNRVLRYLEHVRTVAKTKRKTVHNNSQVWLLTYNRNLTTVNRVRRESGADPLFFQILARENENLQNFNRRKYCHIQNLRTWIILSKASRAAALGFSSLSKIPARALRVIMWCFISQRFSRPSSGSVHGPALGVFASSSIS